MYKQFFGIIFIILSISCVSTPELNMQLEENILSRHNPQNRLIYFFIEKINYSGDFYGFLISDIMSEKKRMLSLNEFTSETFSSLNKPYPEKWSNNYYPVLIQDDFNGISMAAFTFRRIIDRVDILAKMTYFEENGMKIKIFSRNFQINNNPIQYYLIYLDSGEFEIREIDRLEMENQLNRITNYAKQLGKKGQYGFINR
jgi:hypothetical protein